MTFWKISAGVSCLVAMFVATSVSYAQEYDPNNYEYVYNPCVDMDTVPVDSEGYHVLFDGESLFGWRGFGKDHVPDKWFVRDGMLCFYPSNGEGGDLIWSYRFHNFILELDWNIGEGGNSGIFVYANEVRTYTKRGRAYWQDIYITSPEYQLLDDGNHPDALKGSTGTHRSGALYDMIPPATFNARPHGQWNHTRIVCDNGKVEHWQNGVKIVEYRLWCPEWDAMVDASKFSVTNWPLANTLMKQIGGSDRRGYIGFQDHGTDTMVFFKDIRVKILPD